MDSSNIDPLSLRLKIEAHAIGQDPGLARQQRDEFDAALAVSLEVDATHRHLPGWRGVLRRGLGGLGGLCLCVSA